MQQPEASGYYILDFQVFDNDYYAEQVALSDPEISDQFTDGVSFKDRDFTVVLKKLRVRGRKLVVRNMVGHLYSFPVVSEAIAQVLRQWCPTEVELYEVQLDMPVSSKYYFMNILNVLTDCIDLEQSDYAFIMPERPDIPVFRYIEKLVLRPERIDKSIFRIKGLTTSIVVSEALKSRLESLGFEELIFTPTEVYQKDMYSR